MLCVSIDACVCRDTPQNPDNSCRLHHLRRGSRRAFSAGMKRTSNGWIRLAVLAIAAAIEASGQETVTARRIVVSIPDRKLMLLEGDRVLKVYDVAVGKASTPSPHGEFTIVTRAINPVWKNVPPGPANPVGTRWLGLSIKGYGIHGTNAPGSIGTAASHGCIRMRNRDVEELFELVSSGASVELDEEQPEIFERVGAGPAPLRAQVSAETNPQIVVSSQTTKGE